MFERITIRDVASSGKSRISITFTVPKGWIYSEADGWLAFHPLGFKGQGFALLMVNAATHQGPERLLGSAQGLRRYLAQVLPQMSPVPAPADAEEDDDYAPYDVSYFSGRAPGVGGRVSMVATAVAVEEINFGLFGFARDDHFDALRADFYRMIMSFQPLVQVAHG